MAQQFTLAEAFVEFRAKGISLLGRQLTRIRRIVTGTTSGLLKMGRVLARVFSPRNLLLGGAAIAAVGIGLLKLASDAEEMGDQFDDVFKEGAADARQWSTDLASAVGRSRLGIMGFMATVQDTLVPMGFLREEAAQLSRVIVKTGLDIASFKNLQDTDAIERFTRGLTGQHENFIRLGAVINETDVQNKVLAMGFKGTAKEATKQMKVLARMALVLEATRDAQDNASKTAGSLANQWKRFVGILRDLGAALGLILAPAAKEILMVFTEIATIIEANRETFRRWGEAIGAAVAKVTKPLKTLVKIMGQDFNAAWRIIKTAFEAGLAFLEERLRTFIDFMLAIVKQATTEMGKQIRAAITGQDAPGVTPFEFKASDISKGTKQARQELAELKKSLFLQFAFGKFKLPLFAGGKGQLDQKGGGGVGLIERLFALLAGGVADEKKKKGPQFEFAAFADLWKQTQTKLGKKEEKLVKLAEKDAVVQNKILAAFSDIPLARWV